jgi:hypothetical protein
MKSPLLHRGYRVGGVMEDRLGAVGIGEELTQSREAGSTAGRGEGQEGFQLRGGDTRPVHVALGVEVEGQVTDGVQADLDGLQLVRPQAQLLGLLTLMQQEVGEITDLGAQQGGCGLDTACAAGCSSSTGEVRRWVEVAVGSEEVGECSDKFGGVVSGEREQGAGLRGRGCEDQARGGGDDVGRIDRVAVLGQVSGEVAPPGGRGGHALCPAGRAGQDGAR